MSLSVTRNADGTLTVACGGDSLVIGGSAGSPPTGDKPGGDQTAQGPTPLLWPASPGVATLVAGLRHLPKIVDVSPDEDLSTAIKSAHDAAAGAAKPTLFQFHVKGDAPLHVEKLKSALADLGNPDWMGVQIKLTGPADD